MAGVSSLTYFILQASFSEWKGTLLAALTGAVVASVVPLWQLYSARRSESRQDRKEQQQHSTASQDKLFEIEDTKEARNFQHAQALLIQTDTMHAGEVGRLRESHAEQLKREREISAREVAVLERSIAALERENKGLTDLNKCQSDLIASYKK